MVNNLPVRAKILFAYRSYLSWFLLSLILFAVIALVINVLAPREIIIGRSVVTVGLLNEYPSEALVIFWFIFSVILAWPLCLIWGSIVRHYYSYTITDTKLVINYGILKRTFVAEFDDIDKIGYYEKFSEKKSGLKSLAIKMKSREIVIRQLSFWARSGYANLSTETSSQALALLPQTYKIPLSVFFPDTIVLSGLETEVVSKITSVFPGKIGDLYY